MPGKADIFKVQYNSWEYSEFTGMPWGIPPKINTPSLTRNWHFENISFEDPPNELKLFRYKIQILQIQTDQNKAERETFCEDISQRIENDPGLLDLNDLNDDDHCGLCGASATLPVSQNLATKRWIVLLWDTLSLAKSLLHCRCVIISFIEVLTHWLPMTSILGIIGRISRNRFNCSYLRNQKKL